MGVEGQRHAPAALPPVKETRYPLYRRLGGPLGRSGKSRPPPPPGFDPRTVKPVASSCTDWAIPAHQQILTYSMVQSPSWEANWFAASQEIPRISRNPKVHYRTHKRPPPVSILVQASPIQSISPHSTSCRSILILSTHLGLGIPSGLFPSGFPTKILYNPLYSPYAPHSQPISFFLILSPAQYWVRSTDHLAPRSVKDIGIPINTQHLWLVCRRPEDDLMLGRNM